MAKTSLNILALCGSLRARSTNRTLLEAAQLLAPSGMIVTRIADGSLVPHFNADLEASDNEPDEVHQWRSLVAGADGLLVSSAEYAAGIRGAFKNALDWLVGDPRFYQKPVAILRASDRSLGAQAALRLVLSTMSADIVEQASITIPLLGKDVTAEELCPAKFKARPSIPPLVRSRGTSSIGASPPDLQNASFSERASSARR